MVDKLLSGIVNQLLQSQTCCWSGYQNNLLGYIK